jgi:hypothetical protein
MNAKEQRRGPVHCFVRDWKLDIPFQHRGQNVQMKDLKIEDAPRKRR